MLGALFAREQVFLNENLYKNELGAEYRGGSEFFRGRHIYKAL